MERCDFQSEKMNPNSFSILGYLSVLLWLAVPVVWLLARRYRLPGWLALALACAAFVFAKFNSSSHVDRIEVKKVEQDVNQLEVAAAKRKAVEEARGGEVADIRFAEDGNDDFIDKAGMEDADKKYLDSIEKAADPEWKGKKKKRGETEKESGDLEDELGGEEVISGVKSDALPVKEEREPIFMSETEMGIAQRIDSLNLDACRIAILLGILILMIDYLTRMNSYDRSYFPLPLPASWRNAFTPVPTTFHRPVSAHRSLREELAWLVRRGDIFICFTKDASGLPTDLPRLAKMGRFSKPLEVLHIKDNDRISDQFVFESLWYGRSCFTVDSIDRIHQLFSSIYLQLQQRRVARARSNFNVHIIWNIDQALHQDDIADFEALARPAGFSLFICNDNPI
jgi:hypothetical protein